MNLNASGYWVYAPLDVKYSDYNEYRILNTTDFSGKYLTSSSQMRNITFNYDIFSEMNLKIDPVNNPGEWALKISGALGAKEYINPPGGEEIFDKRKFAKANINLKFLKSSSKKYDQKSSGFEPDLSIIDVMMFNSPRVINELLDDYTIY